MLADCITLSRIPFSLLLFAFPPSSLPFAALYLLCGLTDVLDGFAARKLHTASEKGARLDSAADAVFALVYTLRILPSLTLPRWVWSWTAGIAVVKTVGILRASIKKRRLVVRHSLWNKLTGLTLFLLPLSVSVVDVKYSAIVVCTLASLAAVEEYQP